jgi:hypothetical protein
LGFSGWGAECGGGESGGELEETSAFHNGPFRLMVVESLAQMGPMGRMGRMRKIPPDGLLTWRFLVFPFTDYDDDNEHEHEHEKLQGAS